jgi:SET domain
MKNLGINHMLDVAGSTGLNYYNRSIQAVSILEKHGSCVDYIRADKSTIPLAGNGAFANTHLPAGTVVAPMPLIHLLDRSYLFIYEGIMMDGSLDVDESTDEYLDFYDEYILDEDDAENSSEHQSNHRLHERKVIHHQLLLNYCFGHNDSSILLCPYGVGSGLVNHAGPGFDANVKLAWSKKFSKRSEWLNQTLDEWEKHEYNGLAFEFVAIRDIEEDEEILFDYGSNWEQAFYHQHQNEKYKTSIHFMYHLINTYEDDPSELPSYREKWQPHDLIEIIASRSTSNALPPSFSLSEIHIWCRATYLQVFIGRHLPKESTDRANYYPCRVIAKEYVVAYEENGIDIMQHQHAVPEILYTAEIYERDHQFFDILDYFYSPPCEKCQCSEVPINVAFRLPRDAFIVGNIDTFDEKHPDPAAPFLPYLTDTSTFRHEIGIPDEIMPEKWKNLKKT